MCNLDFTKMRITAVLISYIIAQTKAYPMQTWPMYPQAPREYPDDEYDYAPKIQYYYDAPAISMSEAYGQVPYPYLYDSYGHFGSNDAPKRQEERLAALPIGQETWYESDTTPRWRSNDVDDVSAAFLDNLILSQMAQDAERRRENVRAAFPPVDYEDHERDAEDEDVRELKALAGKPFYHMPKTVPKFDDDDYVADDGFINWNGNKRSVTTSAPRTTTKSNLNQKEEILSVVPQNSHNNHQNPSNNKETYYDTIAKLITETRGEDMPKTRRINKRFIAGDSDLVVELRNLKHRIAT